MNQVILKSGRKFESAPTETLLDAAIRSGLTIPYSCKTGRCSTCRCKVLSGSTREIQPELGLNDFQKSEGWILSCARSAESDLIIEVDDLGGIELPDVKTIPCRISDIERPSSDIVLVKLRLPPAAEFNFIPGQYVNVIGPGGLHRSYSLANGRFDDKLIELHIRAVKGGAMSEYWFQNAKINDLLRLKGPLGTFVLRDTANVDLVFLATGTGIAPIKAMLESLQSLPKERHPRKVIVIWGGRVAEDFYFDVLSIEGNFCYMPVLSRGDSTWMGGRGYVQEQLLKILSDLSNSRVYACGSEVMIRSAKDLLIQTGLPTGQFYSDAFVSSF